MSLYSSESVAVRVTPCDALTLQARWNLVAELASGTA